VTAAPAMPRVVPLPLLRAYAHRFVIGRSSDLARFIDALATGREPVPLRVVLLLEVAYRACVAAATLTDANALPEHTVTHVSERHEATRALLALGAKYRSRCSGCGARYTEGRPGPRTRRTATCRVGACAPATGWEIDIRADDTRPMRGGRDA
jgi:hypothetical protein